MGQYLFIYWWKQPCYNFFHIRLTCTTNKWKLSVLGTYCKHINFMNQWNLNVTSLSLYVFISVWCIVSMSTVCKWLGVYLCMRESPATTSAELDTYKVVLVSKGISQFTKLVFGACRCVVFQVCLYFSFHADRCHMLFSFISCYFMEEYHRIVSV